MRKLSKSSEERFQSKSKPVQIEEDSEEPASDDSIEVDDNDGDLSSEEDASPYSDKEDVDDVSIEEDANPYPDTDKDASGGPNDYFEEEHILDIDYSDEEISILEDERSDEEDHEESKDSDMEADPLDFEDQDYDELNVRTISVYI